MWDERATNLGKIIYLERLRRGLTQDELYRGICTQGELTKIESGERVPEKMLADALMQRLGRCTDTLEAIMSVEEYILFDMRETLQRHFYENNYERNCILLEKYARHRALEQPLHRQFFCKYSAVSQYRKDKDAAGCRKALEDTLAITFWAWEQLKLMDYWLCNQELHLLILIAYFMMPEEPQKSELILEEVAEYLEVKYYEEEKVKLYPQCMWLLALKSKRDGEWNRVADYSRRGVECLTKNGAIPLLAELLELRIESINKAEVLAAGSEEEVTALSNQLESLKAVLRCYAPWVLEMDELSKLHYFYHQDEVSLDYEMLRDIRRNKGISQSDVQSCTQGNLSRIENGKQAPSKRRVMRIARELGVNKSYYISRVQSENYDLYELCHWKNQAGYDYEWNKAEMMINKLEVALDMNILLNKQYIEACKIGSKKVRGEIDPEQGLLELEKILRYTMPDYEDGKLRIPSREEFVILNLMAGLMRRAGRIKDGLQLREHMLKIFKESRVEEEYHTNSLLLLYLSYGEMLEADGQLEEAENIDNFGILLGIWCGQGKAIGKILANLAFVYHQSDLPEKYSLQQDCLWHSYHICLLLGQVVPAKIIEESYQLLIGEDINAYSRHLHQMAQPEPSPGQHCTSEPKAHPES